MIIHDFETNTVIRLRAEIIFVLQKRLTFHGHEGPRRVLEYANHRLFDDWTLRQQVLV